MSLIILASFPFLANAGVYINEVAWMGTATSTTEDEWIELRNDSGESVDLENWVLITLDGTPSINFSGANLKNKIILANGYFILERTNDQTLPVISADLIYTGALSNSGENLVLKDKNGVDVDKVDASAGWPAGDNASKQTMQKTSSGWITAAGTPKTVNAEQSGSSNSNGGSSSSDGSQSVLSSVSSNAQVEQSFGQGGPLNWPSEERIFANAGDDKTVVVGADAFFSGKSLSFKKEPLDNAKYLWNFGDGSYAEGQNVKHSYKYPGGYIVALDVSSDKFLASDRLNVKAVSNELQIIEANKDFIKIKNKSSVLIDTSDWFLRNNGSVFKFPKSSFVAAGAELSISSEISKIIFTGNGQIAEILYPNGSVAFSYQEKTTSSSSVSSASISLVFLAASASRSSSASSTRALAALSKKQISSAGNNDKKIIKRQMLNTATATKTNFIREDQLANVITIADKKDFWFGKWLWIALIAGIFGGGGLIFIRRNGGV